MRREQHQQEDRPVTAAVLLEYVLHSSLFPEPPTGGTYYVSKSGGQTFAVAKVRKVTGARDGLSYRLIGSRLRRGDVPASAVVLPWPRKAVGRPSRAAEEPRVAAPIVTRAQQQQAERKRILALKKVHNSPDNQLAEPVRIENKTLEPAEIRDISDVNPNRRTPRTLKTFRQCSAVDYLVRSGTITRAHGRAARMFRDQYEKSAGLGLGQNDLSAPKVTSGSSPVGISEMQLFALDGIRAIRKLLGGLFQLVLAIAVEDVTLKEFARRTRISPSMCAGRLSGALEVLNGHYSPAAEPEKVRHTIGSQTGDNAKS